MKKIFVTFLATASLMMLAFAARSNAAVIYGYSTVFTGDTPTGSSSWATLTIENHASNQVKFTLQANLQAPGEFIRTLWLNIDPFVSVSLVPGSVDTSGGSNVSGVNASSNGHNAPSGEKFDLEINLPNSGAGRLTGTEWVSWILQGTGLTENHFLATTSDQGLFHTMIHVQGIPLGTNGSEGSGKLTGSVIPEPGTILLFAAGLTAPLMTRLRRRT